MRLYNPPTRWGKRPSLYASLHGSKSERPLGEVIVVVVVGLLVTRSGSVIDGGPGSLVCFVVLLFINNS